MTVRHTQLHAIPSGKHLRSDEFDNYIDTLRQARSYARNYRQAVSVVALYDDGTSGVLFNLDPLGEALTMAVA